MNSEFKRISLQTVRVVLSSNRLDFADASFGSERTHTLEKWVTKQLTRLLLLLLLPLSMTHAVACAVELSTDTRAR